jgi:DNA-binding LacI/PurR family transcriptional regulator
MTRPSSSSVTIRDVARRAGVSVATVSRFINRNAVTSREVSERIQKVMDELNYVPHATARQLATRKTRVIGLLLTNMFHDFFAPLLSGVESVVSQNGYNLLVATYRSGAQKNHQPPVGSHNTDGMLVFADSLDNTQITRLYTRKFPLVLIHRTSPEDLPIPCVTVENHIASRNIMEHLITHHKKRHIVFLRGPARHEDSYWREEGYRQALQAHGLPFCSDLVLSGGFERDMSYAAMREFLSASPVFDAVFASDDDSAIGALKALNESGRRVPEDVALVGFNDINLSSFLTPPLTTVHAPTEQVGRMAAQQLFRILENESPDLVTLLPTQVILRRSCGCEYIPPE